MLKINMKYRKGTLIVEIKGRLNKFNSYKLNDYLVEVIMKHDIKKVVYDTKYLTYIDLVGLEWRKDMVFSKFSNIKINLEEMI